jgi:L-asparagine transporter-like permease
MRFPIPSRETTPSEYAVLVVFIAVVFIILGVVALVVAFRAPAEKHDLAVALAHRGFWLLGIGGAIAVGFWLFRRFRDY